MRSSKGWFDICWLSSLLLLWEIVEGKPVFEFPACLGFSSIYASKAFQNEFKVLTVRVILGIAGGGLYNVLLRYFLTLWRSDGVLNCFLSAVCLMLCWLLPPLLVLIGLWVLSVFASTVFAYFGSLTICFLLPPYCFILFTSFASVNWSMSSSGLVTVSSCKLMASSSLGL